MKKIVIVGLGTLEKNLAHSVINKNNISFVVENEDKFCQKVIHHTCKHFDLYNGCMRCLVNKYEPKSAESTSK